MSTKQAKRLEESIQLPEGVQATYQEGTLTIKKDQQQVERKLFNPLIKITSNNNTLLITSKTSTRKSKRIFFTTKSHVNNMVQGVTEPFTYQLKICSGHFPMTIKTEGKTITITNFLGEKIPRSAKIHPEAEAKVDKDIITITSPNKEAAGQTAANIEKATIITNRDPRVFQDGCYIIQKPGRKA